MSRIYALHFLSKYWFVGMSHKVCLSQASEVCLPGGELEQYHVTSSPESELVVDPPSFLWLKNYSSVITGVIQHEAPS